MKTRWPKEPTTQECTANARIDFNGEAAYARTIATIPVVPGFSFRR